MVDTSFTVGTFYEQQLTKMGAEVDLVDTLQAALEMLQNVPEDEKMHDMLLISTFDLNNDALMDAIDATGVPIVAFHADMNTLDDDILSKGACGEQAFHFSRAPLLADLILGAMTATPYALRTLCWRRRRVSCFSADCVLRGAQSKLLTKWKATRLLVGR